MSALTDDLWLAAHDGYQGKLLIGDWPLGVGLAAGLLAELIIEGFLELEHGELIRSAGAQTSDVALSPVLAQMEREERGWRQPPAPAARARAQVPMRGGRPSPTVHHVRAVAPPVEENSDRRRGHQLDKWLSYLTHEDRAKDLVGRRLARVGWATTATRRRWWVGPTTMRLVPRDSVTAGSPANAITVTMQRKDKLDLEGLLLAGLFLATGLHQHALATLEPDERARLSDQLARNLPTELRELLQATDAAVGEAAMRSR